MRELSLQFYTKKALHIKASRAWLNKSSSVLRKLLFPEFSLWHIAKQGQKPVRVYCWYNLKIGM